MENHLSYLKIPLPLIRELLVTPRSAADIIRFSIYWMASESLTAREEINAVRLYMSFVFVIVVAQNMTMAKPILNGNSTKRIAHSQEPFPYLS